MAAAGQKITVRSVCGVLHISPNRANRCLPTASAPGSLPPRRQKLTGPPYPKCFSARFVPRSRRPWPRAGLSRPLSLRQRAGQRKRREQPIRPERRKPRPRLGRKRRKKLKKRWKQKQRKSLNWQKPRYKDRSMQTQSLREQTVK